VPLASLLPLDVVGHPLPSDPYVVMIACPECGLWHRRPIGADGALNFRCGRGREVPVAVSPEPFRPEWIFRLYCRDNIAPAYAKWSADHAGARVTPTA